MKLVLTRPEGGELADLQADLGRLGIAHMAAPLLDVTYLDPQLKTQPKTLFLTSTRAVPWIARHITDKNTACIVVGEQTALALNAAGFNNILTHQPDAVRLMAWLAEQQAVNPALPPLPALYVRARDITANMPPYADEIIVYETTPVPVLPENLRLALQNREKLLISFLSKRTAAVFADLVERAGLASSLAQCKGLCLSETVLFSLRFLPWGHLYACEHPDRQTLLKSVQEQLL